MLGSYLAAIIRTATPLLLAGMGSIISEQVGVFNISLEGAMNIGAFVGVVCVYYTALPIIGVAGAIVAGGILALIFVLFVEFLHANATIAAIGVNTLSAGLTTFLTKIVFNEGLVGANKIVSIPSVHIRFLTKIPFLNTVFNNHTILVYIAPIIVVALSLVLFRTSFGIKIRASGKNALALETAGYSSRKYRLVGVITTGLLCGLAGAHLALGYVSMFSEGLIAGRGYIAYSAAVFGMANPGLTSLACLIFAFADALSYRSQQIGIATQIVSMMPYIATVVALTVQGNKMRKSKLTAKL